MHNTNKNIKRVISISAAALCMISSLRTAPITYVNIEADAASVMSAFEITKNMQFGWNLGNTFDSYVAEREYDANGKEISVTYPKNLGLETETAWGNPTTTKEMIHAVKAKGFSTIRIPTTWFQHVDESNGYKIDPAWLSRVKEVVDWSLDEGLYVILNMHHEETWQNSYTLGQDYARIKPFVTSVWAQLADEFKDYDQHLVFEAMNEPRAVGQSYEWWAATAPQAECDTINKLNADIVSTIRGTSSSNDVRLIMLPSYCASSDPTFMNQNKIPSGDAYLAASVHAYTPYNFTMNNEIADHSKFTGSYKNELVNCLTTVKETFIDKNIPVVIGEMSASNYLNTDARVAWAQTYAETAKSFGIPCVLWDNNVEHDLKNEGESHGYFDRKNLAWYEPSVKLVDKFLSVFNDSSSDWGKEPPKPVIDHDDISTGTTIYTGPKTIDKSKDNEAGGWLGSIALDVKDASQLKGKDLAIKYTGDDIGAAVSGDEFKNWTELKAYDVDKEKGIAYVSMDELLDSWDGDISSIAHLSIKTYGVSTVESATLIKAAEHEKTDKTKKFKLDLSTRDGSHQMLMVTFTGAAGSVIEGAVGYADANAEGGWSQVTYKGTINGNGKYTVQIPLANVENGIPTGVTAAEAQIWYCEDEEATMSGYQILGLGAEETTTTTTTTVTTTTTSETTTVTTTTVTTTNEEPTTTTTGNTLPVKKYGDANDDNDVSIDDAVLIMQALANPDKYGVGGYDENAMTAQGKANADCYQPGTDLTAMDALAVQRLLLHSIPLLPVNE